MNDKPNVLMYGWELPPHNTGGLGVACYGLTKSLAAQGTHISFVLPKKLDVDIPFMEVLDHNLPGVEVTAINSLLEAYGYSDQYQKAIQASAPSEFYAADLYEEAHRFADAAYRWSANKQFDLVHGHDWMTYPAGMLTSQKRGKPFVAHVHATEYDRTGGQVDSRIADIEYHGLQRANKIIAVSQYTKNIISNRYSVNPDKIVVVHNGHTPVPFSASAFRQIFKNDHVVLFVGRLTFQKGVDYFLQSAQRVLKEVPNTVFIVAGDGDQYTHHLLEAAYLGISSRVIFTGFLKENQLQQLYRLANVFVMPSVSEPYGLVALEAIAAGAPAIISKNAGVTENLTHIHTVDFWDTDKTANLIIQSILFPKQAKYINERAQQEVSHLTWDSAAAKTLAVYQALLN